jgi:hypothetical protein
VKLRHNYTFNRVANGSSASLSSCRAIETQLQIEISMDSQSAVAAAHKRIPTQFVDAWARIRTSQFWMVAIALFLRVGWIIVGHTYKFKSAEDNFGFGWEMGRIGAAIASGRGFSDAFGAPTGPTAWEPPLYPYLTAGVFHIFGIYSRASAFIPAHHQQHFFRTHLHPNFPHCAPNFLRQSRGRRRLDLGASALRHVLVHPLGMGDESLRPAAGRDFLAGADHGRSRAD